MSKPLIEQFEALNQEIKGCLFAAAPMHTLCRIGQALERLEARLIRLLRG